jgi:hypothetical protein
VSLAKYLKGIPPEAQTQALRAAACYIYTAHLSYLKDIQSLSPSKQAEVLEDLAELKADAREILDLHVVGGLLEHKLQIVDRLNTAREITVLKLAEREKAKLAALEKKNNPLT